MEKFIIMFECKSYNDFDDSVYTNFGPATDRAFDTYEEAHDALVNELIPDLKVSMDEGYAETAEEDGVDINDLREISVEMYNPAHPYDLVASVELYDISMGCRIEENNYKIISIIC